MSETPTNEERPEGTEAPPQTPLEQTPVPTPPISQRFAAVQEAEPSEAESDDEQGSGWPRGAGGSSVSTAMDIGEPGSSLADGENEQDEGRDKEVRKLRNEAKNLRARLRATEAELAALKESLVVLQRQSVDSVVSGSTRITPAALWAWGGAEVGDLLAEDGSVDVDKVKVAADTAATELGLIRAPAANPAQGQGSPAAGGGPEWSDVFKAKRR